VEEVVAQAQLAQTLLLALVVTVVQVQHLLFQAHL
jgi:hypothetical protein